ncbi:MAG: NCS2 family permease [Puniceicoccaceae bacterium]|nr:MAG: NCS2 family permease [Puniceicoccaceae bacterium]
MKAWLDRFFQIEQSGSTFRREWIGGLTTFAAMAYILAVNPLILADAGMPRDALITVTALAAAFGCFLMAGIAKYPIALAPGMGTNAYFAYVICIGMQVPWQAALGITLWNGVIFLILSVTGLREKLAAALPGAIKLGIQAGIGIFIAFIGLTNVGIIIGDSATLVTIGNLASPASILVVLGLVLIVVLSARRVPGAILISIFAISVIGLIIFDGGERITALPSGIVSLPAGVGEVFLQVDWLYPFREFSGEVLTILITLLILDLFDSLGTLVGLARRAGFMDEKGNMPRMGRALSADATATIGGALLGTSTTTSYVESAAGIEAGARTGLASVYTGLLFLLALIFTPLLQVIPAVATTPALVMVGLLMMQGLRDLDFSDLSESAPALLTMLMIPLTFSITEGIGLGLIVYTALQVALGRWRSVPILTYFIAVGFAVYFAFI